MLKVIGFIPMSKRVGKVVFVQDHNPHPSVVGLSCDKLFVYDDLSNKIDESCIGKSIEVSYGRGYNGSAFISDISIK